MDRLKDRLTGLLDFDGPVNRLTGLLDFDGPVKSPVNRSDWLTVTVRKKTTVSPSLPRFQRNRHRSIELNETFRSVLVLLKMGHCVENYRRPKLSTHF